MTEVVDTALMDLDLGEELFEKFLHFGLKLYEDLITDGWYGIKDTILDMSAYKSITLPKDCIDWIICGVQVGTHVYAFTHDSNMGMNFKELNDAGTLTSVLATEQEEFGKTFSGYLNEMGEDVGKLFGLKFKHNSEGYFQENEELGEIYFNSNKVTDGKVFLRYISDCSIHEGETLVHRNAKSMMVSYIQWQYHLHNTDLNKKRMAGVYQELYAQEYDRFVQREVKWGIEEIKEVVYDAYSLTPNY